MDIEEKDVVENINTTENTDTRTVEQNEGVNTSNEEEKKFTQAQLNEIVNSRVKRAKNSESKKYSDLMNVLKSAMGTDDVNEITKKAREYYENQGITIPEKSEDYSDEDIETLAKSDANEIANGGYDEIVDALNDLKSKPNLSKRERKLMSDLTAQKKLLDDEQSLKSIGVDEDIINGKDFKNFRQKFNDTVDLKDVYELYSKLHQKEEVKPLGSVKSTKKDTKIKEYYSPEDFDKLTKEDLDNPKIWEAVMKSKAKWI